MADFPKLDEEFKRKLSAAVESVKETVSDAILKEDGTLDTERIGNAVTDTARKVEGTLREGYQKFSETYVRDGALDKEKLEEAAGRTYRRTGRALATGVTKLAGVLSDKFGTVDAAGEIIDSELATETAVSEEDFQN